MPPDGPLSPPAQALLGPLALAAVLALAALGCAIGERDDRDGGAGPGAPITGPRVIALAGPDLEVLEGARVVLDGNASRALAGAAVLTWTQVDGPAVLLTNPSDPAPAFLAPFAPATLVFELRAASLEDVDVDQVVVHVREVAGAPPRAAIVPADVTARPGEEVSFSVRDLGGIEGEVVWSARARCAGAAAPIVARDEITLTLPAALPCIVVVDGTDALGTRTAPAARVFWPAGTPLPLETRLDGPTVVEPAAPIVLRFGNDAVAGEGAAEQLVWTAGGTAASVELTRDTQGAVTTSPRRPARLSFGAERRLGGASGGVRYVEVDVTAGSGNRAPRGSAGPDRVVAPGGRFALAVNESADDDADPLAFEITQVFGPTAVPEPDRVGFFRAPDAPGTLLFVVSADDGTVLSPPDTARVVVDARAKNEPPTLDLAADRWVAPGATFVLDARGASDPDSGIIARVTFEQDGGDAVSLLPSPVDGVAVSLVAGAAGDVYRFAVTVIDGDGLSATAHTAVHVEAAGPWVDAARGDDSTGNGTVELPFATIDGALSTAMRHRLDALQLAEGEQYFTGRLPPGLSLRGGFAFDGLTYLEQPAPAQLSSLQTVLVVDDGGVVVDNGLITRLRIALIGARGGLELRSAVAATEVRIEEGPHHAGPLLRVRGDADADLERVELAGAAVPGPRPEARLGDAPPAVIGALTLEPGATAHVADSTLVAGAGERIAGVACSGAFIELRGSSVLGRGPAAAAYGIVADGCDVRLTETTVSGGEGLIATGALLTGSTLVMDDSAIVGARFGRSTSATGLSFEGTDAPLLRGSLAATADEARAQHAVAARVHATGVVVDGARLTAEGVDDATALEVVAETLRVRRAVVRVSSPTGVGTGITARATGDVDVSGTTLGVDARDATGMVIVGEAVARLLDSGARVAGAVRAMGLDVAASPRTRIERVEGSVSCASPSCASVGMRMGGGEVVALDIDVKGAGDARGISLAPDGGPTRIERSRVVVDADQVAAGVLAMGDVDVRASFIHVRARGSATGVDGAREVALRRVTIQGDGACVRLTRPGARLDIASALLVGDTGIVHERARSSWTRAAAVAFDTRIPVSTSAGAFKDLRALEQAGCRDCQLIQSDAVIDETAHLLPGDNPLVDAGDASRSVPLDLDGDMSPVGNGPDIGCDERAP